MLTTRPEHRLLLIDTLLCNPDMDADVEIDEIVRRLCKEAVQTLREAGLLEPVEKLSQVDASCARELPGGRRRTRCDSAGFSE